MKTVAFDNVISLEILGCVMQLQCTGGTAGCSAFIPQVVQCYNRGTDGIEVQVGSVQTLI